MPDGDIVVTLERMATETALSWSDIRKPQEQEPGYEWYVAAINEVKVLRAAAEEIKQLRAGLGAWFDYSQLAERDIETLHAERDELRRKVCELQCSPPERLPERFIGLPHELAKFIGWDCFDTDTKENT